MKKIIMVLSLVGVVFSGNASAYFYNVVITGDLTANDSDALYLLDGANFRWSAAFNTNAIAYDQISDVNVDSAFYGPFETTTRFYNRPAGEFDTTVVSSAIVKTVNYSSGGGDSVNIVNNDFGAEFAGLSISELIYQLISEVYNQDGFVALPGYLGAPGQLDNNESLLEFVSTSGSGFGYSTNNLRVNVSAVPVPAAMWLFSSGLLGLAGLSRRKKI